MTDHIDDIQQRLESILLRLAPLRNEAMEQPLEGFDWAAADAKFNALQAEATNILGSSPDRTIRGLRANLLVLGRWPAIEQAEFSTLVSSTSAQSDPARQKHQIGEMCAKLDHEIRGVIRDDLSEIKTAERSTPMLDAAKAAANAAFPAGIPTRMQLSGAVFRRKVRQHLPKDWAGSDKTIDRVREP